MLFRSVRKEMNGVTESIKKDADEIKTNLQKDTNVVSDGNYKEVKD